MGGCGCDRFSRPGNVGQEHIFDRRSMWGENHSCISLGTATRPVKLRVLLRSI